MIRSVFLFVFCTILNYVSPNTSYSGQGDTYVYICTGAKAYSYHNNRSCKGLNRCQAEIKKVTITYAKSLKRKPCKICY